MTPSRIQSDEPVNVSALRRGDRATLESLLKSHYPRLYHLCLRMLGNRDDAAECVQEAMLKVVQHAGSFDGRSSPGTWITRIAMNQALTHLRRRKIRLTTSLDQDDPAAGNGQGDSAGPARNRLPDFRELSPGQRVEHQEMHALLQTSLATLDESFRSVLILRDIQQLDYGQIADVLEVPVGTVKSRLFRARLALRQAMVQRAPHTAREEINHG